MSPDDLVRRADVLAILAHAQTLSYAETAVRQLPTDDAAAALVAALQPFADRPCRSRYTVNTVGSCACETCRARSVLARIAELETDAIEGQRQVQTLTDERCAAEKRVSELEGEVGEMLAAFATIMSLSILAGPMTTEAEAHRIACEMVAKVRR